MVEAERFNKRDLLQVLVGSSVGAMSFSVEGGLSEIGGRLSLIHIIFIVIASVLSSYLISYGLGIRRLGKRKIKYIIGFIPTRTLVHYLSALLFSAFFLWLFAAYQNVTTYTFYKTIIVLALPAVVVGSATDLIDSQKWTE